MGLPVPNLDDRTFQDLVREARSMIPRYCPEWTDHNLSDPGITLIELFAWMTDVLLYRLNKVPRKNYIKFLDMIGVKMAPASPAAADITFRLSAPQPAAMVIRGGTEAATLRTETEESIVFSTDTDLRIEVPGLSYFLITRDDVNFVDFLPELGRGKPIDLFREVPQEGNAFYLGYGEPLGGNILSITMDCMVAKGIGVMPDDPPLAWEYWDGATGGWQRFDRRPEAVAWLERDGTAALNRRGNILLHLPRTFSAAEVGLRRAYWIRCRVVSPRSDQPSYQASPAVLAVDCNCVGGTVLASHCVKVRGEQLGESDGNPGQAFKLKNSPILTLERGETVEVEVEEGRYENWEQMPDFSQSEPEDKHFVCDTGVGEIQFGLAIRQPDGEVRQYGAIPRKGRMIKMSAYRCGGGSKGNVGRNTLTVLKTAVPYVASVTNRRAATGGTDPESVESAIQRGPQVFRTQNRAVTEADYEHLALEASPSVARASCVQPREIGGGDAGPPPGMVFLLVIPVLSATEGRITPEQLELSQELKQEVQSYLDDRRLLTSSLVVTEPRYYWASVEAKVRIKAKYDAVEVRERIEKELYRFINPLTGGPDGRGWPFGRDLIVSEVYSRIQGLDGVEYVEEARIYPVNIGTGERGESTQRLVMDRTGILCSHDHMVGFSTDRY
jgi:predicted phage baseplate assembly protein